LPRPGGSVHDCASREPQRPKDLVPDRPNPRLTLPCFGDSSDTNACNYSALHGEGHDDQALRLTHWLYACLLRASALRLGATPCSLVTIPRTSQESTTSSLGLKSQCSGRRLVPNRARSPVAIYSHPPPPPAIMKT